MQLSHRHVLWSVFRAQHRDVVSNAVLVSAQTAVRDLGAACQSWLEIETDRLLWLMFMNIELQSISYDRPPV